MQTNGCSRWELDTLFPGGSQSVELADSLRKWETDLAELRHSLTELSIPHALADIKPFQTLLDDVQSLESRLSEAVAFQKCLAAQNTLDEAAKTLSGKLAQMAADYAAVAIRFQEQIAKMPEDVWQAWLRDPDVAPIAFVLQERRQRQAKQLPPALEMLAHDLQVDGYHAYSDLYKSLLAHFAISVESDEGTIRDLQLSQMRPYLRHQNRAVRAKAFAGLEQAFAQEQELFAHALNHLAGFRLRLYERRGWTSVLQEPLANNRLSEQTLTAMWDVVERNKGTLVRFLERKAQLLGVQQLSWYDVNAPLQTLERKIGYEEAAAFIIEQFRTVSPQMSDFAARAIRERWVEAEQRDNKMHLGFAETFPVSRQSRVFLTFADSFSSLLVLAHELGHAYHSDALMDVPSFSQNYPMSLAETASTFAETVVLQAAMRQTSSPQERIALLELNANHAVLYLMTVHSGYLFEKSFYERRRHGVVTAEELGELMVQAERQGFGDALEQYYKANWMHVMQHFMTDQPFYNFPYAFGYLFSNGLYAQALQEGPAFADKYAALLRDTGRMTAEELAQKHLGVNLMQRDFWQSAVEIVLADVEEFLRETTVETQVDF